MTRPSYASWPPPASASHQPAAPQQPPAQQYYVFSADNNHVGPVSADLIARGVAAGKVQTDSLVAPAGSGQWVPLTSIPELAAAVATHAPHTSNMRPASQPGTMLVQQAPQPPRLPQDVAAPQPSIAPPEPAPANAQVGSPLEIPPPKVASQPATPAKEEKGLDPRFKLLPLAIFGCFAFLGVIETAFALVFIK